jgi:uncharacterized phage protein gp47/JayE
MTIILPESSSEILQTLQTDFVANIPESDPFIRQHWLTALLISMANRDFDIYTQISQMIDQLFPNTATGTFARQWGNLKGVEINPATSAQGFISVTGIDTTIIPLGTIWANEAGAQYESTFAAETISVVIKSVDTLISSGGIAQATTAVAHNFATGMSVIISGATQSEYNGTFIVTAIDQYNFKYNISGSPLSPAGGTILAQSTFATVFVESIDVGNLTNVGSGGQLTLLNPIAGADSTAYVQLTEIGGGSDAETNDEYRDRYLERYQNLTAHFNVADIIATAKTVPGVTRVFPEPLTPLVGDVTVTFMRDNDPDPIPNAQEVQDVEDALSRITPANTPISATAGLIVKAPVPVIVAFTFSALTPNTTTMQEAIEASLTQFFRDSVSTSNNIEELAYTSAILDTVDPATGKFVESFTLTVPPGEIVIDPGEIGVLGTVTFP